MIPYGNNNGYFMKKRVISTSELGTLAREARKEQGLTQEDLAGICGTGRRFISDFESGKESSQIGKVLHVLSALGLSFTVSKNWEPNSE